MIKYLYIFCKNVRDYKIMRYYKFSGYDLKFIAIITMLIDHLGASLLWRYIDFTHAYSDDILMNLYTLMRYVGRMAFPIYCFLLVEGFLHTKSVSKYALRLGAFALISEVPFDLALNKSLWAPYSNNVFFTLFIGLILIWGISFVEVFYSFWKEKKLDAFIGTLAALAIAVLMIVPALFLAEVVLKSDYGMGGVLTILVMYLFRKYREIGYILATIVLYIFAGSSQILGLFMLLPISLYDGSRGPERGKFSKYFYYAFYPAHLLAFGLICVGLGI